MSYYLCYTSERPSGYWLVLYFDDFILAISLCMEVVLLGCCGRFDYATGYDFYNLLMFYNKLVCSRYVINIIIRWLGILQCVKLLWAMYLVYWLGC